MSSVSFETSMPMLTGDGDNMIDSSPFCFISLRHPGLRIRAPWPTQLFGFCKESAWRHLLNYGFKEPSPATVCHAEPTTPVYHLLEDTSPALQCWESRAKNRLVREADS